PLPGDVPADARAGALEGTTMRRRSVLWLAAAVAAGSALADDAVDMKINPQNSYIEAVKSEYDSGSYDIHPLISQSLDTDPTVYSISTDAADDRSPRVEITPAGDTFTTWWRDLATDEVHVRAFYHASQALGSDRLVSQSGENARNPEIVFDGTSPVV